MGNTSTCCNHPNDQNGLKEANLTHPTIDTINPAKGIRKIIISPVEVFKDII
jgi:hypothetical protein